MKQKLRIIPSAFGLRSANQMRFLRFGDEIVIYPAMGSMSVEEVIKVLGEIADTKGRNHHRYELVNTVTAKGATPLINSALTNAYAEKHVQKYQKFANVSINPSEDIKRCGCVIKHGRGSHGEIINKFREQFKLPPIN